MVPELGGFLNELEAEPFELVLELGFGGFPKELNADPVEPMLELGLGGFPTELEAEPIPGGGCPADGGAMYAASASKPGILEV